MCLLCSLLYPLFLADHTNTFPVRNNCVHMIQIISHDSNKFESGLWGKKAARRTKRATPDLCKTYFAVAAPRMWEDYGISFQSQCPELYIMLHHDKFVEYFISTSAFLEKAD